MIRDLNPQELLFAQSFFWTRTSPPKFTSHRAVNGSKEADKLCVVSESGQGITWALWGKLCHPSLICIKFSCPQSTKVWQSVPPFFFLIYWEEYLECLEYQEHLEYLEYWSQSPLGWRSDFHIQRAWKRIIYCFFPWKKWSLCSTWCTWKVFGLIKLGQGVPPWVLEERSIRTGSRRWSWRLSQKNLGQGGIFLHFAHELNLDMPFEKEITQRKHLPPGCLLKLMQSRGAPGKMV